MKPVLAVFGAVCAVVVLVLAAVVSGAASFQTGPPRDLGAVEAPANIVALDEEVAADGPCQLSASLLLAQQDMESGYQPTVVSSAGAVGLAQFLPSTFPSYAYPVEPGGANPPTPDDPVDSAWAEARFLCSLGAQTDPELALAEYDCGAGGTPACLAGAEASYAEPVLALAARIAA